MTTLRAITGRKVQPLDSGWELALSPSQAWMDPAALTDAQWLPAMVPGTAAGALRALGQWSFDAPQPLHDRDAWYRLRIEGHGPRVLQFDGLATHADVFFDGRKLLTTNSMYEPCELNLTLSGDHWLHIAFRSLRAALAAAKGPRPRWKTMMIEEPKLRFLRTTLIGHMPGWCPPVDVVGPYRAVTLIEDGPVRAANVDLRSRLIGTDGVLTVALDLDGGTPVLHCAGASIALSPQGGTRWSGTLRIPDVAPWWPHTHGTPALHAVSVACGDVQVDLGHVGFRHIDVDRGPDGQGFTILVNGTRVFCRGACWTPLDIVTLQATAADYARDLGLMQRAGINMVRLSGTLVYEASEFYRACDALGIMVWQDAMMANFDYPSDPAFAEVIRSEITGFIRRVGASPSLVVMCGGSEVGQQAAMMGLPRAQRSLPLPETVIPEALKASSDVIYVPGSPSGSTLPFVSNAGPSHYYGVGAYLRPLDDARRAQVRFASECLAFANLPDERMFAAHNFDPAGESTRWLSRIPRDGGASWDFDDVREHYLGALWQQDGRSLRAGDPARWRALSRAIVAEVIERTIDEWRRPASITGGALLWLWRDLWPGAGWGLVDADGRPKSAYYALRRAALPRRLSITDEGTNGLYLHLVNDAPQPMAGKLTLRCLKDGRISVIEAARDVTVAAHGGLSIGAFELFDGFFDAGHCYRFGPAPHDTVHAVFAPVDDAEPIEAFHLLAPLAPRTDVELTVTLDEDRDGYVLTLAASATLHFVAIADASFVPDDNDFHLAAGINRSVRLRGAAGSRPSGSVSALNAAIAAHY